MEQAGLKRRDLIPFIGSRAKVSEILSGRRAITMPMARALHEHLGIPADALLRRPDETPVDESAKIEWTRFPLRALAKRGWIPDVHELAHVGRHMNDDGEEVFVDDLTLRRLDGGRQDPREAEADEWAEEALVPRAAWEASDVRDRPTPMAVLNLAQATGVHPAIVAGRVRYETGNYRLLSQFVGTGEVRRQFR